MRGKLLTRHLAGRRMFRCYARAWGCHQRVQHDFRFGMTARAAKVGLLSWTPGMRGPVFLSDFA